MTHRTLYQRRPFVGILFILFLVLHFSLLLSGQNPGAKGFDDAWGETSIKFRSAVHRSKATGNEIRMSVASDGRVRGGKDAIIAVTWSEEEDRTLLVFAEPGEGWLVAADRVGKRPMLYESFIFYDHRDLVHGLRETVPVAGVKVDHENGLQLKKVDHEDVQFVPIHRNGIKDWGNSIRTRVVERMSRTPLIGATVEKEGHEVVVAYLLDREESVRYSYFFSQGRLSVLHVEDSEEPNNKRFIVFDEKRIPVAAFQEIKSGLLEPVSKQSISHLQNIWNVDWER